MTKNKLEWAGEWITRLYNLHGLDGVIQEVATIALEEQTEVQRRRQYQSALYEASKQLESLAYEVQNQAILDMANQLHGLWIQAELIDQPKQTEAAF